jgi:NADH-quinone oxidoreductase subunit A
MLETYIPIFIVLFFATVIALGITFSSIILGPQRPTKEKLSTYESGMKPVGTTRERISIKFPLNIIWWQCYS